jgi:hypothetical protein
VRLPESRVARQLGERSRRGEPYDARNAQAQLAVVSLVRDQHALVNEPFHGPVDAAIESIHHLGCRTHRKWALKNCQLIQQNSLVRAEMSKYPRYDIAYAGMPRIWVVTNPVQVSKPTFEPLQDQLRSCQLGLRGGQLDRERKAAK